MHGANAILPHHLCLSPEFPMSPTVFFIHRPNFVKQWAEEHFWNFCFKSHRCPGLSVCLGISEVVQTLFCSVNSDKGVFPSYDMSLALQIIAWECHWVSHVMIPWHLQTQLNNNNEATYQATALQLQSHLGLKVGVNFRMLSLLKWHEPSFPFIILFCARLRLSLCIPGISLLLVQFSGPKLWKYHSLEGTATLQFLYSWQPLSLRNFSTP